MAQKLLKVKIEVPRSYAIQSLKRLSYEDPEWLSIAEDFDENYIVRLIGFGGINRKIKWHKDS